MKSWYTITNKADAPAEILLYGEIGRGWDGTGVDPTDFVNELGKIPQDRDITLRVHSPGGNIFDGLVVYNRLKERREHLKCIVDGLAASAASWIALAGKTVEMPRTARMMIHDAQGLVLGDSSEMREMAELLDRESDNIASIYSEKTGRPREEMRQRMRDTTWMNGDEAKAIGLCDIVTDSKILNNTFDLSRFLKSDLGSGGTPANAVNITPTDNTMPDNKTPTPAGANPQPDLTNEITELRNGLKAEREKRIKLELRNLASTRPTLVVEDWEPRVLADPDLMNLAAKIPQAGSEPVPVVARVIGNPAIENYRNMVAGPARRAYLNNAENWTGLVKARQEFDPRNGNTLAAGLIPDVLADSWITIAHNRLAMLNAFSTAFSPDPGAPRRSVEVAYATAGANTVTNGTNFETGDGTLAAVKVDLSHYSKPFHLDNNALNQGFNIAALADINANGLADAVSDVCTALMIAANYGAATAIGAAASFDSADLPAVLALAKNYGRKNLILDGGHLAYLLPTDRTKFAIGEAGAYGFDLIVENNRWTSGVANICGFVCAPTAMAVASGLPYPLPNQYYQSMGTAALKNGLTVATCSWFSAATRLAWASFDVCFGAKAADTTAAENLVTS